jgi:hypothetical protein
LSTGKSFTAYLHKKDKDTINAWREIINDKYALSNPDEPERKQAFVLAKDLPKTKKEAQHAINQSVKNLIEAGAIQNRDELIETLEKNGFEIARKTKKSISIADPEGGQNIRLTGAVYEQDFRFSEDVRAELERTAQQYRENSDARIRDARATLRTRVERKRDEHCKRYQKTSKNSAQRSVANEQRHDTTAQNEMVRDGGNHNAINRNTTSARSTHVLQRAADSTSAKNRTTNSRDLLTSRETEKSTNRVHSSAETVESNNDRVRTTIIETIRRAAEKISSAIQRITERTERFRENVRNYAQREQGVKTDAQQFNETMQRVIKSVETKQQMQQQLHDTSPKPPMP